MPQSTPHTIGEKETWTVASLTQWGAEYLAEKGFDSPRLTTELLLAHVLRFTRLDSSVKGERPLTSDELNAFNELLQRKLDGEPLQYITREAHFMGLVFRVDRRVLVPRPETEILTERLIDLLRSLSHDRAVHFLEIGTGSGNIAVSIAKSVKNVRVTAIDVSNDALQVARSNADLHHVADRVTFRRCDVFSDLQWLGTFDGIVSNPPYVSQDEAKTLSPEIIRYEPPAALFDGGDGLKFFKRIAEVGKTLLTGGGWVLVETSYNQGDTVRSIFVESGYRNIRMFKDYGGNDRVVQSQRG